MNADYHIHSTYSDGDFMKRMVRAAEKASVSKIGFADHANVSSRNVMKNTKRQLGFNLDITYKRRRKAINTLQERTDVKIFDAAEIDYHPKDTEDIKEFQKKAGFDYTIGSVHHIENVNIHIEPYFKEKSGEEQHQAVDRYFELLEKMIKSEIFDIASHIDLVERNQYLKEKAETKHYEKIAKAFKNSETVPEINGGRITGKKGLTHPSKEFHEILISEGINFVTGSDSHTPDNMIESIPLMRKKIEERGLDVKEPF